VYVLPGEQVTASLTLALPAGMVYGADIRIAFDPAVASTVQVTRGALIPDWMLSTNLLTAGVIQAAMAGAVPVNDGGELLKITFQADGIFGSSTALDLIQGDLNEGSLPAALQDGAVILACPGNPDVTGDGQVSVLDISAVAERWNVFEANNYSFVHDLNCDGMIDIVDIQSTAAAFGN
jgi:hypothetical protein